MARRTFATLIAAVLVLLVGALCTWPDMPPLPVAPDESRDGAAGAPPTALNLALPIAASNLSPSLGRVPVIVTTRESIAAAAPRLAGVLSVYEPVLDDVELAVVRRALARPIVEPLNWPSSRTR